MNLLSAFILWCVLSVLVQRFHFSRFPLIKNLEDVGCDVSYACMNVNVIEFAVWPKLLLPSIFRLLLSLWHFQYKKDHRNNAWNMTSCGEKRWLFSHFHKMFTLKEWCSLFRIRNSYSQNMKAFVPSDGTDILERCLLRCSFLHWNI